MRPVHRLSCIAVVALVGCSHQPPKTGPLGATASAQFVGRCDEATRTGFLRNADELTASLGACKLDPRVRDLDWTRWSVIALGAGTPKIRGTRIVAVSKRTKPCEGGSPPGPLFEPPPGPGEPIAAMYYVIPSRVETLEHEFKVKEKRCRRRGPPPV